MTDPWALIASAADVDAGARAEIARQSERWLATGGSGVALVTCHRAELYGVGPIPPLASAGTLVGEGTVNHLLRVACGLESVIVGEDEVLHQVRQASRWARDRRLQRLFQVAIATGRKARSRRSESSGNLAQRAVSWLREKADLAGQTVVVAGAGRMGAALAHALDGAGAKLILASRDPSRADRLARVYSCRGVDLGLAARLAADSAGVAVALGGPWTELATAKSDGLPPIADISAPQAVPDAIRRRLNGSFLGIDDLYHRAEPLPGAYIEVARGLVARTTAEYMAWLGTSR